jgi:hypothetical protein
MCQHFFTYVCVFTISVFWLGIGVDRDGRADEPSRKAIVSLYLDTSGSMAGKRAQAMTQAAKLLLATLDHNQEVVIVPFNHAARASRFSLATPLERDAAMRFIDSLVINGGTDYLYALKAGKLPAGTPGIFLSDGEHNGDPAPVLAYVKKEKPGPLFTVAIEAPAKADKLLTEMAALTGGNHVRVEHSEALVNAFLDIAKHLGNYRTYTPKEDRVECKNVVGKLIAFGFDAVPEIKGQPAFAQALYQHQATLPGEHVHLASIDLAKPTAVTIEATNKRSANGRLAAILRQDLLRAEMKLHAPDGKAGTGTHLRVTTRVFDSQGNIVDPRRRTDVFSSYQLLDQSGKVVGEIQGKPSPTHPAFEATIPLPQNPGPVIVRNATVDARQGLPFEAEQKQIILLQKPVPLSVQPGKVALSISEGRFTVSLAVKHQHEKALAVTYGADLEGIPSGLRCLEVRSKNDVLELDLEARPGIYKGTIVVHGTAELPLETVRVPLEILVKGRSAGLALAATRDVKLGPVLANSGSKAIATLEFPSLDKDEANYTVDVEDLSQGSAVIPCQADRTTIPSSKGKAGKITLTADIGNVSTGTYTASVQVKPAAGGSKLWRTNLTLQISEPLTVQPVDFGTAEVGKIIKRNVLLKNAGEVLRDIRFITATIKGKGGDIAIALPEKTDIGGRQDKEVAVTVAISPLVESRGVHKGTLILRRTANQDISIPLQIDIVDVGKGPCGLLVAPPKIHVRGKPGEVLRFEVRTKLTVEAGVAAEELTAVAGTFKDKSGKAIDLEVEFKWAAGSKLTRTTPATVQGFVVVPDHRGIFTTTVTIRSANCGTILLPMTLEVQ